MTSYIKIKQPGALKKKLPQKKKSAQEFGTKHPAQYAGFCFVLGARILFVCEILRC